MTDKITVTQLTPLHEDSECYWDEQQEYVRILFNGDDQMYVGEGEPEDMTLGRNLSDLYNVMGMLEEMYEAGKAGKEVIFKCEQPVKG